MSIIFLGGNLQQIAGVGGVSTAGGTFDSNFSKFAYRAASTAKSSAPLLASASEWWFHTVFYNSEGYQANFNVISFTVGGTDNYALRSTSGTNFVLSVLSGASWSNLTETAVTLADDTLYTIDIHFHPDGTTGVAELYVDGVLIGTSTGAIIGDGGATIDGVSIRSNYLNNGQGIYFSEMVMTNDDDEPTIGWHVSTLLPTAAGATSGWTGAYTDVDETILDTGDYLSTNTDSTITTMTFGDIDASVDSDVVVGVYVCAVVSKIAGAAVTNIDVVARPSTTNYFDENSGTLATGSLTNYVAELPLNPETAGAWTVAAVEGCEFGFRANT